MADVNSQVMVQYAMTHLFPRITMGPSAKYDGTVCTLWLIPKYGSRLHKINGAVCKIDGAVYKTEVPSAKIWWCSVQIMTHI